mmetsp:Transcript_76461/g.203048  ORF Transcript_76461/g.203048 Transcript_76461/m.203048 type:complete len:145 (-) Transcript_76461:174-608(-)
MQCGEAHAHYLNLMPCLQKVERNATMLAKPSKKCVQSNEEIKGILAYRRFLSATWDTASASAVFVAFHNLVTGSVGPYFRRPEGSPQYCLTEVLADLQPVCALDSAANFLARHPRAPVVQFPLSTAEGVPGLAQTAGSGPKCKA